MPLTEDVPVRRRVSRQAIASAQRRVEILDAAETAFTEKGFNGSSIRDVASRAGLSHTGVLHHFPDKAAILEAVLDRRTGAEHDLDLDPSDGLRFLRALVALAERDAADPRRLRMFRIIAAEALAPSHPAHGHLRQRYERVRASVQVALTDLDARGLYVRGVPVADAAVEIASMRDGLDSQWLLDPRAVDLVAAFRAQLGSYVAGEL